MSCLFFMFRIIIRYFLASLVLSTDEMLFSSLLINKQFYGQIGSYVVLAYTAGVFFGSVCWKLVGLSPTRKNMFFIQLVLFISIIIGYYVNSPLILLCIKLCQGFFVTVPVIYINLWAQLSLSTIGFNRFLAFTHITTSIIEGLMPALSEYCVYRYGMIADLGLQASYIFFSFIYLIMENSYKSIKASANILNIFMDYKRILFSVLFFPLLAIGIINGIVEVFLLNIDSKIISTLCPLISLGSFIMVNLSTHFSSHQDRQVSLLFDWKTGLINNDIIKITLSIFSIFVSLFMLTFVKSFYLIILFSTSLVVNMYIINYLCSKALYCIYASSGCITSLIILLENFCSLIIQGVYKVFDSENFLIGYLLFNITLVVFLVIAFYILLIKKASTVKKVYKIYENDT